MGKDPAPNGGDGVGQRRRVADPGNSEDRESRHPGGDPCLGVHRAAKEEGRHGPGHRDREEVEHDHQQPSCAAGVVVGYPSDGNESQRNR